MFDWQGVNCDDLSWLSTCLYLIVWHSVPVLILFLCLYWAKLARFYILGSRTWGLLLLSRHFKPVTSFKTTCWLRFTKCYLFLFQNVFFQFPLWFLKPELMYQLFGASLNLFLLISNSSMIRKYSSLCYLNSLYFLPFLCDKVSLYSTGWLHTHRVVYTDFTLLILLPRIECWGSSFYPTAPYLYYPNVFVFMGPCCKLAM